jgi:quercetin dioxygenase-like cupin family protein
MHVNLFDRPRLVVDLLCLEPEQEEARRGFDRSDSLLMVLEGEARLRAGPQIESLQSMDAVLVPPGQEYLLTNTGAGQMTAVVILTPKPTRADEVRVPPERRPFRTARPEQEEGRDRGREGRPPDRAPSRESGQRGRALREGAAPERRPYPRREEPGARGRGRRGAAAEEERPPPRRGTTGARPPRGGEGAGPVWYPKPKPAWRPRGAPPTAAGRGRPSTARGAGAGAEAGERAATPGPRPPRGPRREGPGGPRSGRAVKGRAEGPGTRGRSEKKTGDARRASRGQGPLSGRRGPGRSGPRTSAPRQSPE